MNLPCVLCSGPFANGHECVRFLVLPAYAPPEVIYLPDGSVDDAARAWLAKQKDLRGDWSIEIIQLTKGQRFRVERTYQIGRIDG